MRIRWTKLAQSDLDHAYSYILLDNPKAARAVIKKVENLLNMLLQHPEMGRPGRIVGTKELIIPSTPFVIPYRIIEREIHILAFMHASRRWPDRFK